MKHARVALILVLIILAIFTSGCEEGLSAETLNPKEDSKLSEKLSLEEAIQQAGFEIITPEYLPEGYAFNYSMVYDSSAVIPDGQDSRIVILNYQKRNESFQIKETVYERKLRLEGAEITIYPGKPEENSLIKLAEKININGRDGKYLEARGDLKVLQWELEGVEITLKGSLEKTEMLKIAESIQKPFTEFYILGPEGTAENYPTEYMLEESDTVIVGIINHEQKPVNYMLEVKLEDTSLPLPEDWENIFIENNETLERAINITPPFEGTGMKLEFLLYNKDKKDMFEGNIIMPYRDLHLWINVKQNLLENGSTPLTEL